MHESESSRELVNRARDGDRTALSRLFARHLPQLRRWAHGRLPPWARRFADTTDFVQDAFLNTFRQLPRFEPRERHALRAYLRRAVQNRIRDELRRIDVRIPPAELTGQEPDPSPSPLAHAVAAEQIERYRAALAGLSPDDRELIVGRIELGYNYHQLAMITGRRQPDAARVALKRAVARLLAEMSRA